MNTRRVEIEAVTDERSGACDTTAASLSARVEPFVKEYAHACEAYAHACRMAIGPLRLVAAGLAERRRELPAVLEIVEAHALAFERDYPDAAERLAIDGVADVVARIRAHLTGFAWNHSHDAACARLVETLPRIAHDLRNEARRMR